MFGQNVGAPGGCVEALDGSPMPPMIDADGVLANANFGFMPAMVAIRHNAKLKAYYERRKNGGKHTTVAQVAVMRKLLVIAHSLYKSQESYKEE